MRRFASLLVVALGAGPATAADIPADWAFKPVLRPGVPTVKGTTRTPVDAFLLARLEAKRLTFAPAADRRTLVRRLSFDLHGLPPTPEEVAAFLNDAAPDAYEKLVDRLLASPRYGERMALFWLDLARYAESDGFKADDARPNAWRYRDYVIRSFNADKPFDRFVREQLAGDELFPGDPDALTATGFLRHYPYEYNAVDVELKRQDILNDLTDTTAGAFLGLTLGCAKCHDHKTDPVTQEDYYRVQAFFAGYWPVDGPLLDAVARKDYDTKRAAWEAKTAADRAELAALEGPYREKMVKRERMRFAPELLALVDMPEANRTPLQKQMAAMVAKQVSADGKDVGKTMKGADKEKWDALAAKLAAVAKDKPADPPRVPAMTDTGPTPPATFLLKRGNWRSKGENLEPGFIASITPADPTITPTATTSGRRAALASWIADAKNPLTARVIVNRVWQHHFGVGIVPSSSDFGVGGDRPSHPELLDWLASEFVTSHGWSLKKLHRQIVTSAVYRQSARGAANDADPDNALLWQYPRRRLDGEALRDAVLMTAGVLNTKAGGPSVYPELPAEVKTGGWKVSADPAERNRRSVYVGVKRNLRYPFFSLFDSPERVEACSRRFVTTTAPQALTLLNDAMILGHAKTFATRVTRDVGNDGDKVVTRAVELALGRPPSSEEKAALVAFLRNGGADAVTDLCHALLNLNEFLYID
ncbi:DUF1549 and DUF1553 domain-containing protein [Urbifossiella limnaea]|uniref:DUF1553 domain-containing protein n=1 Tax=Urbifossiella limnaea TaxID=2528023 RepID=A0A517XX16_9BACT|nr:DUF1549 and DUF1553 domain-containing protein [Urbifossiella limnaea]QDU22038.1 hypothetical protein ETAA1_40130 [Urbifossiella limnaea]